MFKEKLLIGEYYATSSPVHELNAVTKLMVSFLYMISLFIADNWWGWGSLTVVAVVVVGCSRIPLKALWRGLKLIFIFCLITMIFNFFLYPGEPIWSWGILKLSREGISYGLAMGLRLFLLVGFASLLTLTTKPIALTDGLEKILTPLKRIGVPAHEIAMMMSIALRFIPTILEEFDRIVLAQRARGASISKGNLFQRCAAMIPLLVPLLVAAFRRADDLAQAMEAKCYSGGTGRS
ncbi:MAG: energy-coupling factor transporter transmembrane component T, partial [Clostridiales bacterium]